MYSILPIDATYFFNITKAFFLKVEGVLTDGRSIIKDNGNISIFLNEKDTFALRMARMKGYPIGIYSDELTNANATFFMRYGIKENDLFCQSTHDRLSILNLFTSQNGLAPQEVLYTGSDILDLGYKQFAGLIVAPNDATDEFKAQSNFISQYNSGNLFVRDIIQQVLSSRGDWSFDPILYKELF